MQFRSTEFIYTSIALSQKEGNDAKRAKPKGESVLWSKLQDIGIKDKRNEGNQWNSGTILTT
jgi:hypothetical protein